MSRPTPGAKARSLGAELRLARKALNLTLAAVGESTGWSESKVSRLETGARNTTSEDVATLLQLYAITGPQRDRLIAMARTIDEPGWWETAFKGLPQDSVTLASHEADAVAITNWAPLLVPGLLQTMEYTRAYMLAGGLAQQDIGVRVMARQRRQEALTRVKYTAYLAEGVLRQRIGGPATLAAQLRHLHLVSRQSNITLRVVSSETDAHSGLIGSFMMMEFDAVPPVVYVELRRSSVFLDGPSDTNPYEETLSQLASLSLDEEDSRRCITRCIEELESESL
jgi:transcriptional regulator with XRE-family HTH domain